MRIIELDTDIDNYFEHSQLEQDFHLLFVACSNNKKIIEIYKNTCNQLYMHYRYNTYSEQKKSRIVEAVKEHESIYNSLLNQNKQQLTYYIELHISNTIKDYKTNSQRFTTL